MISSVLRDHPNHAVGMAAASPNWSGCRATARRRCERRRDGPSDGPAQSPIADRIGQDQTGARRPPRRPGARRAGARTGPDASWRAHSARRPGDGRRRLRGRARPRPTGDGSPSAPTWPYLQAARACAELGEDAEAPSFSTRPGECAASNRKSSPRAPSSPARRATGRRRAPRSMSPAKVSSASFFLWTEKGPGRARHRRSRDGARRAARRAGRLAVRDRGARPFVPRAASRGAAPL